MKRKRFLKRAVSALTALAFSVSTVTSVTVSGMEQGDFVSDEWQSVVTETEPVSEKITFYAEGISRAGSGYAGPEQINGVYQITSSDDLCWFAKHVNSGNKSAGAVLTADIDMSGVEWTTICETGLYYNKDHGIKDVKMEYALCPLRHLYSYILDSSPHSTNEFQNVRAMGNLIVVFQKLLKDLYDKETVCNMILDLFPQIREVEKQQVLDYLSVIKTHNHLADEYEGYEFTPYRFMISYPDNELLESTIEKYSELGSQLARTGINLFKPTDVKKACMYCPHEAYCRNCVHGIDQGDYYD